MAFKRNLRNLKNYTTKQLDQMIKDLLKESPDNILVDDLIKEVERRSGVKTK